jgi:hypothetical protein
MPARHFEPSDAADPPGAIASHCFKLAEQIGGGPVRDALVEMGRDYSARARETAQTAGFRLELARSRQDGPGFWPLRLFADLLAPLPARPARREVRSAPVAIQPATTPQARHAAAPVAAPRAPAKRSQRASRMFRMHALASIES